MPKHRSAQRGEAVAATSITSETPPKPASPLTLLKKALHFWHKPAEFAEVGVERHSAIQQLLIVQAAITVEDSVILRTRNILLDALHRLKPDPDATPPTEPTDARWRDLTWRPYLALLVAYFDERYSRLSYKRRFELLFCSSSTFYQWRDQGIQQLDAALNRMVAQTVRFDNPSLRSANPEARHSWAYATPPKLPLHFVGREELLTQARVHIADAAQAKHGKIIAMWGTPGMGKTALLTHLAHDTALKRQFPDGVLWATLGETDEGNTTCLLAWADAVGLSTEQLPHGLSNHDLSRILFNAIGTRRFLLLVDDVWSEQALEPFNICGPNCVLVFATRSAELAHRISTTHVLQVKELDPAAALSLLIDIVPRAMQYEPERVEQLMTRLAGWPQALHLAASQLRMTFGDPSRRLRDKLDALLKAPGWDALNAVIDSSVTRLHVEARDLLYALSAFNAKPTSFAESAAVAIGASEFVELDLLIDAGLIETHTARAIHSEPRLMIHQSVLDYARAKLSEHIGEDRRNASERFVRYFCAYAIDNAQRPHTLHAESDHLLRAVALADELGFDRLHTQLVITIVPFLKSRAQSAEAMQLLHAAYPASQRLGDMEIQTQIANALSQGYLAMNDLPLATHWAHTVVHLTGEGFTPTTQRCLAAALDALAQIAKRSDDQTSAIRYAQQAWATASACGVQHIMERQLLLLKDVTPGALGQNEKGQVQGDLSSAELQGRILHHWQQNGIAYIEKTDLPTARNELLSALKYARQLGATGMLVNTLGFLTLLHCTLGEFDQAIAASTETFQLGIDADYSRGYGFASAFGALAHLHRGHLEHAQRCVEHGLKIAEALGSIETKAWVCFASASLHLERGDLVLAAEQAQLSVLLCQQGNLMDSLATMWGICGRVASAQREFDQAQAYFEKEHACAYNELQRTYAQADMGLSAEASSDFARAEQLLHPAFDYHIRTQVWRYVPRIGWGLARALVANGKCDESRIVALRALQCAKEIRDSQVSKIRNWLDKLH